MSQKITLLLLLLSISMFSQEIINQEQTTSSSSNAYLLAFDQVGQSFTSSTSSKITRIEVLMDCGSSFGCLGQVATLNLHNANTDNTPNGAPIVSNVSNTQFNGGNGSPVWSSYVISSRPNLVNGSKYTFTVSGVVLSSDYGVLVSGSDSYTNGGPVRRNAGSSNAWTVQTGKDIAFKVWVENTLGIEELVYSKDFFLYQSDNKVIIKSFKDQELVIYDISGKKIRTIHVQSNVEFFIETNEFSKGIYILNNNFASNKFIIQ